MGAPLRPHAQYTTSSSPAYPIPPANPPPTPSPGSPATPSSAVFSCQTKLVHPVPALAAVQCDCTGHWLPPPLPPLTSSAPHVLAPPLACCRLFDVLHSPVPVASNAS